jgi:hypothetical protein
LIDLRGIDIAARRLLFERGTDRFFKSETLGGFSIASRFENRRSFQEEEPTMKHVRFASLGAAVATFTILVAAPAAAQVATGVVAGVVKDATGGVMPGVTVEASSPALIEKTRSAITDGEGQYKIISLPTGTYTVTFTLEGFNIVKRENIDIKAAFTAAVNAEMRIGSLQETITVSGASPTVDVQNVLQQSSVSRDIMDSVPAAKTFGSYAVLLPGVTVNAPDVGGAYGDLSVSLTIHGSRSNDSQIMMDGMLAHNGIGGGGGQYGQFLNNGMMQEISFQTAGISAELESAGVYSNVIPRDGGNAFKGVVFGNYSNSSLNSANVSDALKAQGLQSNSVDRLYDFNPSVGGRVIADKLWFFLSFREWGTRTTRAGAGAAYPNATPGGLFYTPDLTRRAFDHSWHLSASDRMTWQAAQKSKVAFFYEYQNHNYEFPTSSVGNAPETRAYYREQPQYLVQATWTSPVTNRLLFEAGGTLAANDYIELPESDVVPGVIPITELSTNFTYRASATAPYGHNRSNNYNYRASASYVTGSHAFKVGLFFMNTWGRQAREPTNPVSYSFRNGIPVQLTEWAVPISYYEKTKYNLGLYAQDRWTFSRVTLNLGMRSDMLNMEVEPQSLKAGPFVPARNLPGVYDVPKWRDLSPRLGVSYDVFGNGRTAVKASIGRYVVSEGIQDIPRLVDPSAASVLSVNRTWTDANGSYTPECDLANPLANGECGQLQNLNFGTNLLTTQFSPTVSSGFGVRPHSWEGLLGVQHEVVHGLAVNVGYDRRFYGNFFVTQNLLVSNGDFSPYCVTAPVDSRLPGGGGNQICGFYDITPSKLGQNNNLIKLDSSFGGQSEVYDGFDFTANAHLPKGVQFSGGVTVGRDRTNNCNLVGDLSLVIPGTATGVTSPRTMPFCDVRPPFQPNAKFLGVFPLPWGLQTSATFQSIPGPMITASYSATNAQIAPSLGRTLSSGVNGTALIDLIPPGTMYADRINQLDLRATKVLRLGNKRVQLMVDLYNALNASPFLTLQTRYGSAWLTPTQTLIGRLMKFAAQINF